MTIVVLGSRIGGVGLGGGTGVLVAGVFVMVRSLGQRGDFGINLDAVFDHSCVVMKKGVSFSGGVGFAEIGGNETIEHNDMLSARRVGQHLSADQRQAVASQVVGQRLTFRVVFIVAGGIG